MGKVVVKYVDESGNEISSSTTKSGNVGESYTTTAKTISGYELVSTPSNASGKFTNGTITVTYKYKKSQEIKNPGYVKVRYFDVDTNQEIASSITLKGEIGTSYSTTQKTISGYTFDSVIGKTSGTYKDGTLIVTYRYRKSSGTVISINSFTSNKVSPQVKGTSITLTAKATGEGTLQYRFRVGDGKGNYSTIKNYSTSNTVTWNVPSPVAFAVNVIAVPFTCGDVLFAINELIVGFVSIMSSFKYS